MNDENTRDRSPNCPKIALEEAIKIVKLLYEKAGKTKVKREVAASALGFSGITGSSLTVLGALMQYGLIEKEGTGALAVSPLAIKILHPTSDKEANEAKIVAALTPKVFNALYTEGFHHASQDVLANNLIQNKFTKENAEKVSAVFLSNISFANLDNPSIRGVSDAKKDEIKAKMEAGTHQLHPVSREIIENEIPEQAKPTGKKVLAQYSIPIGANEATITFTGEKLSVEDFTALGEYVTLFKTQFERKQNSEPTQTTLPKPPFVTKLKTADFERMVEIVGSTVENGETIYQEKDGTSFTVFELFPNLKK
ncbi:MAG: hypothetical protein WBN75_06515 [Verrucomicrobiia bacterium]